MKKIFLLPILLITVVAAPAFSQTYKTADSIAFNKEYAKVSSTIADLNTRLTKAQNDLAEYSSKSDKASSDAQGTATATARRAKKEARRSLKDAKDSRKAGNALDNQNKKISQLTTDLTKNQDRLKELDRMRAGFSDQQ